MRFGEKIVVFFLRPIYRTFFQRLVRWNLAKLKAFFLAETEAQISECLRKLERIESEQRQQLTAIEERLRAAEASNAAQWDGLEQLLLAMFRQPESRSSDAEWKTGASQPNSASNGADLNRVHAAGSIR
jgi:hypothetical protein